MAITHVYFSPEEWVRALEAELGIPGIEQLLQARDLLPGDVLHEAVIVSSSATGTGTVSIRSGSRRLHALLVDIGFEVIVGIDEHDGSIRQLNQPPVLFQERFPEP